MAFTPTDKTPGDPLRSQDWNDHVHETLRLESAKVNRSGDTITGNLTIGGALNTVGNVGIGTAGPQAMLTIQQGSTDAAANAANRPLFVSGNLPDGRNGTGGIEFRHDSLTQGIGFGFNTIYATGATPNQDLALQSRGTGDLLLNPGGGNVGVNRDNPLFPLHFPSNLGEKIVLWGENTNLNYGLGIQAATLQIHTDTAGGRVAFGWGSSANFHETMHIQGDGTLVVQGAITPNWGNSTARGIMFPTDPGGGGGDSAYMRYYPRSGESCTLEIGITNDADDHIALMSSGNVGVGTINPQARLHITSNGGMLNLEGAPGGHAYMQFYPYGIGSGRKGYIGFPANGSNQLYINNESGGAVFIAPWPVQASDVRLKTNIAPLEDPLGTVCALRGVTYEWKRDAAGEGGQPSRKSIGFIAQEVEQVLPGLVHKSDKDQMLHLDYTAVIPVLVEAIKQQQNRIDALTARSAATP